MRKITYTCDFCGSTEEHTMDANPFDITYSNVKSSYITHTDLALVKQLKISDDADWCDTCRDAFFAYVKAEHTKMIQRAINIITVGKKFKDELQELLDEDT